MTNDTEVEVIFFCIEKHHKQLFMHELKLDKSAFSMPEEELICCGADMEKLL